MQRLWQLNSELMQDIRNDSDLMDEIESAVKGRKRISTLEGLGGLEIEAAALRKSFETFAEAPDAAAETDAASIVEAIILRRGRPSFLIQDDSYIIPPDERVWLDRLNSGRSLLEEAIKAVGRIELRGHSTFPWVGTGWLVEPDLIVTNRHVASEFAAAMGRDFVFRPGVDGQPIRVNIDFKEEFNQHREDVVAVERVLFMAPDSPGQPDMAILKLARSVDRRPIPLADSSRPEGEFISVIGYPARDDRRNDPDAAQAIFRDIYEKKRFAPGKLQTIGDSDPLALRHDCSTLGGNSGSAVIDVISGKAVGLHFGGRFELSNFAVRTEVIRRMLAMVNRRVAVAVTEAPASPQDYVDRPGYQPDFLGDDDLFVPLPKVAAHRVKDVQRQTTGPHKGSDELRYMHFSIMMSKSRKMPYFTASNIDGDSLIRPKRKTDVWRFDPRIPQAQQLGNALYAGNKLDRGHQVRRLDPVWGDREEALLAQEDTFHFTNSCPQHSRLNQGKAQWAGLEDFILDNTDERNLKVCVFTGPVLNDVGVPHRGTLIPEEYWKVVANVQSDGTLSATGYVLSQGQFLGDIEFAFGPFRTFQVPITKIEELTDLSFGMLSTVDPLALTEGPGSFIEIDSLDRIIL